MEDTGPACPIHLSSPGQGPGSMMDLSTFDLGQGLCYKPCMGLQRKSDTLRPFVLFHLRVGIRVALRKVAAFVAVAFALFRRIHRRLEAGAAVVVVSHTIEPFIMSSGRVVTVKDGSAVSFEDLPPAAGDRLKFLDSLAKGQYKQ